VATKTTTKLVPIVVTTSHRGVFFGYGEAPKGAIPDTLRLEKARMCVSWSSDIRGVTGLAAVGPSKNCKVGIEVPAISVNSITAIFECSEEAAAKWEQGPWA
jgi:hypothetical protein